MEEAEIEAFGKLKMLFRGRKLKMGRLIVRIMLFAAGFAAALYLIAPPDEGPSMQERTAGTERQWDRQQMREDLLALSCKIRLGIDQAISFAEEKSVQMAEYFRQEMAKRQAENGT
jgi:hypothetical protein